MADRPLTDEEAERLGFADTPAADPMRALSDDEADQIGTESGSRWSQMLANGLTFGLRPRIQAAIETGSMSGPEYEAAKQEQWAKDDAYREENPGTALALEMTGSLPTMFVPGLGAGRLAAAAAKIGTAAPKTLSGGQRAMRALGFGREVGTVGHEAGVLGAKVAATTGALGSREDTTEGRITEGVSSAPLGYGLGRAGDALLRPLMRVGEGAVDAARIGGNAKVGAMTGLGRAMERDGVTPAALRDEILPDMGGMKIVPGGPEEALIAYGDEIAKGSNPRVAQAKARQAYIAHAQAQGQQMTPKTLAGHANAVVKAYTEKESIPLAVDEVARLAGGRGQNLQWTRRAAEASPGEGREKIAEQVIGRQEGMIDQFRGKVNAALGDEDFLAAKDALVAKNRAREDALYGIARNNETPFDLAPAFDAVNATHAFRGGDARDTMLKAMQIMRGDPLPNGAYQPHTLDTYIQSRGQLNDLIEDSMRVNPATGVGESTSATRALLDLKSQMDAIVAKSNPRWKWANDIARGGRSVTQAMDEAKRMTLSGADQHTEQILRRVSAVTDRISTLRTSINSKKAPLTGSKLVDAKAELGLLETQLEGYRMGFGKVLHKELSRLGDTHDLAKLFTKGGAGAKSGPRQVIKTMMGDDAPKFMEMVERAKIAGTTFKNRSGSQTTPLREAIDEAKEDNKIAGALRMASYWARPDKMLSDVGEKVANRLTAERNTALLEHYAKTTENPADFLRLLRDLENFALGRNKAFTSEGLNLYSAPGVASGAFSGASVQDQQGD
jgi:hypothetical protein